LAGRYSASFLRRVGLPELIVDSPKAYVQLALKLGNDTEYRQQLKQRVLLNSARLFDDQDTVLSWEKLFVDKVNNILIRK